MKHIAKTAAIYFYQIRCLRRWPRSHTAAGVLLVLVKSRLNYCSVLARLPRLSLELPNVFRTLSSDSC